MPKRFSIIFLNMPAQKKRNPVMQFLLTFAVVYLLTSITIRHFFPDRFSTEPVEEKPMITLSMPKKIIPMGRNLYVQLTNASGAVLALNNRCPDPPVTIERILNDKLYQVELEEPVITCEPLTEVGVGNSVKIDLSPWKYSAFSEPGIYKLSLPEETGEDVSIKIKIKKPGAFVGGFRTFVSKPLFNGLVLIASVLPNHSLGWAIIVLTLLVKLVLLIPSQHALEGQKKMQAIQPKLEAIKKKHKDNQQKVTEETMALWKKEKINPMQSCLPTVIQIPILLGLFFIIRDSGAIELAQHLLYPPLMNLDWSFAHMFLGVLDLTWVPYEGITWSEPSASLRILLFGAPIPLTLALMQFAQMKMMTAIKGGQKKLKEKKPLAERLDAQTMMIYMFPIMIFFIAGSFPTAVTLYWATGTVFSIGQQVVVNRKKI